MRPRGVLFAALCGLTALPLTGCERLCSQGAITFCAPRSGDHLNDAPEVGRIKLASFAPPRGRRAPPEQVSDGVAVVDLQTRLRLGNPDTPFGYCCIGAKDPNGDPLLFEWDLDGDGEFDAGGTGREELGDAYEGFDPGAEVTTFYRRPGGVPVTVRVSDFPRLFGAPGVVTRTRLVQVVPAGVENTPPQAAFTVSPDPPRAGEPVTFDAAASSDPDAWDAGSLLYRWRAESAATAPRRDGRTLTH